MNKKLYTIAIVAWCFMNNAYAMTTKHELLSWGRQNHYGDQQAPQSLQDLAQRDFPRENVNVFMMNAETEHGHMHDLAFSVQEMGKWGIWLHGTKFAGLSPIVQPIIKQYAMYHELGHLKNHDHVKRAIEQSSSRIVGIVAVTTIGFASLCGSKNQMRFLKTGTTFGLLSLGKMSIDQTSWHNNMRQQWYFSQERRADSYAISKITSREDLDILSVYLNSKEQ